MKSNKTLRQDVLEMICKNKLVRSYVTRRSHLWFFNIFFAEYVEYETAPFQYEIFALTERTDWNLLCLVAFRGSAKSTLLTLSYVLWAILGIQQKKFVLIVAQTQSQAKQHMMNLRGALEHNEVLRRTLGPFREETDTWGASTIVFTKLGARISVASVSEAIRGIKHLQHRPDLVIIDDPEDLQSARTKEGREKIYNWFKGEVMPLGSKRTRFIVIGNVLHEHCLVMRLKQEIGDGMTTGIYREYVLIGRNGESMWPGKFPTMAEIEAERKRIGNDKTWFREYLLQVIADDDQIIKRDWITYYDVLPDKNDPVLRYRMSVTAVDPGTKNKEGTDPTAIVHGHLYGSGNKAKIYISPIYYNDRLDFGDIIKKIKEISTKGAAGLRTQIVVEAVQAQVYIFQDLNHQGYPVSEFYPNIYGSKEQRLMSIGALIQNGQIVFHRGCEEIINQAVNFGLENHDDLCDALTMLVIHLTKFMGYSSSDTWRGPTSYGTPRRFPDDIIDPDTEITVRSRIPGIF